MMSVPVLYVRLYFALFVGYIPHMIYLHLCVGNNEIMFSFYTLHIYIFLYSNISLFIYVYVLYRCALVCFTIFIYVFNFLQLMFFTFMF